MRPSSSSTHPPLVPLTKNRKRRWSGGRLSRMLEVFSSFSAPPLPLKLPPSPPASRPGSPLPSFKRKLDSNVDAEHAKRPRTNATFDRSSNQHQHPPHPSYHSRHLTLPPPPAQHSRTSNLLYVSRAEPSEDGEVPEEAAVASTVRGLSAVDTSFVPVRRPRRGRPPHTVFDQLHDQYHHYGRLLKYSGDRRIWSTYPSTHREYCPLADPPPTNSPYHKYGPLIARLELIDALVCFAYSIWNRDYHRRICSRDTWGTIEAFLTWCKHKWSGDDTVGDREKAFIGLIWMIEGFIASRKLAYQAKSYLDPEMDKLVTHCKNLATAAAEKVMVAEENQAKSLQPTPPMLPSPASITHSNSANSTPISQANGTPNAALGSMSLPGTAQSNPSLAAAAAARLQPPAMPPNMMPTSVKGVPLSPAAVAAAASVTVPISPTLTQALKDESGGVVSVSICMGVSQQTLNLPVMSQHFPTTFSRMVHSSLLWHEEHEPDIEDEEGELFWPGQCATGEGLGWVCLMGKAMIKEFGKDIGYRGLDGVIPKPKPEDQGPETPASVGPGPGPGQSPMPPGSMTSTQTASGPLER